MADSMVERVATAIGKRIFACSSPQARAAARAALAAAGDPTEAMCWRGLRVAEATGAVLTMTQIRDIWQAMNDEALTENGE